MITLQDLDTAICKCQGDNKPNAKTCIMLAAFLTIRRELFGDTEQAQSAGYSLAAAPTDTPETFQAAPEAVGEYGESDFLQAVAGCDPAAVWAIMDELMETLQVVNERVYNGIMRKINRL